METKSKIYSMGDKKGIYLSRTMSSSIKIKKGEPITVIFKKKEGELVYLTKYGEVISLRKDILNLIGNEKEIIFNLRKTRQPKNNKNIFKNGKIDICYFIKPSTRSGSDITYEEFNKNGEKWIVLWCSHKRGSGRQFKIKRYLNISNFGYILGQLQAEGTKGDFGRLEFCNKSAMEHKDFVDYLVDFGIDKKLIISEAMFHHSIKNFNEETSIFEETARLNVSKKIFLKKSKGGFSFKTYIRSNLLADIFLNAMDKVRNYLVSSEWGKNENILANCFLAKLLTGDGSIDMDSKDRNIPQARLKITDRRMSHLLDYKSIMEKYRLKPKINEKEILVRCSINKYFIKKLKDIGAFKNNPNDSKLDSLISTRITSMSAS